MRLNQRTHSGILIPRVLSWIGRPPSDRKKWLGRVVGMADWLTGWADWPGGAGRGGFLAPRRAEKTASE